MFASVGQGLTQDYCEVSLSCVFEDRQAYVALSWAKVLKGLHILNINKTSIIANKEVLKFYIRLHRDMSIKGLIKIKKISKCSNPNYVFIIQVNPV